MSFINSYKPTTPATLSQAELYGPEPFDINFVFPLRLESLETERVKLVPFNPRVHGKQYWGVVDNDPDFLRYYSVAWPTFESFLTHHETRIRTDPGNTLLAIIDKTRLDPEHPEYSGSFAGALGLFFTSEANLTTEIAFVAIFPAFQRTHVASNAVGALLRYCLEPLDASPPGLGLRRVQWCAHEKNLASVRLAERMGFKREGLIRWHRVLPEVLARDGNKPRPNDRYLEKYSWHIVLLSACWDDWEQGVRDNVRRHIDRKADA